MSKQSVLHQLADLTRRVEALEARLGQLDGRASILRETGPVYVTAEESMEEGVVVPAKILRASGLSPREFLVELAVYLFDKEVLTLGQAKALAGMSMADFMQLLGQRGVNMHYDVEEFKQDIETLKRTGLWE